MTEYSNFPISNPESIWVGQSTYGTSEITASNKFGTKIIVACNNVIYFYTYKILCPLKNCHVYNPINKILTYRDGNHLTIEGSLILKKKFDIFLNDNSKLFN